MREATFISDMGLGDVIIQSGGIALLSQRYDRLTVPCRGYHERSVRAIYSTCSKVDILVLREKDENGTFTVQPKDMRGDILSTVWLMSGVAYDPCLSKWENDYASLGLDYSVRWDCCPIPESAKMVDQIPVPEGPFAFVHDDPGRGFYIQSRHIGDMPVVRVDPEATNNILAYCSLISRATQGHFIDSSFRHLAESIEPNGELFYHEYARPWSARRGEPEAPSRKKWTIFN